MTNISPRQGDGLHFWLLKQSRDLLMAGHSVDAVHSQLLTATADSGRTTQDIETEIKNAIDGASDYLDGHPNFRVQHRHAHVRLDPLAFDFSGNPRIDRRKVNNVSANEDLRRDAYNLEMTFGDMYGVDDFSYRMLFANINFNIAACINVRTGGKVRSLEDWNFELAFPRLSFIVPSYFIKSGCTRADLNVGERLFIVIEFDNDDEIKQLCFHNYLMEKYPIFPLVMLVSSGHHSIHGWYACYGRSEYRVRTFQRKAKMLGADQTCASPSQWIRMPNGYNHKYKARQEVLYFNAEALELQNKIVRKEML